MTGKNQGPYGCRKDETYQKNWWAANKEEQNAKQRARRAANDYLKEHANA